MIIFLLALIILSAGLTWVLGREWHTHHWGPAVTGRWSCALLDMSMTARTRQCQTCRCWTVRPISEGWVCWT